MAVETKEIAGLPAQAAPVSYTVSGDQKFTLVGVRAVFDGSAAGAFLPCVQVLSPAGHILAQSVGTSVAAGGSADVSFFPSTQSSGSGGTSDPLAVHFNTSPQANSFLEVETTAALTGFLLNATNGGTFNIEASGSAASSQVAISADAQVFQESPLLTNRLNAGGTFEVQNHSAVDIVEVDEDSTITFSLASGKSLTVKDHLGNAILRVDETGPGYHIKTGGAWVADL